MVATITTGIKCKIINDKIHMIEFDIKQVLLGKFSVTVLKNPWYSFDHVQL